MTGIRIPKGWEIAEALVTDESRYLRRREFIKAASASALLSITGGCRTVPDKPQLEMSRAELSARADAVGPVAFGRAPGPPSFAPGAPSHAFPLPDDRILTDRVTAASFNNFYEFTSRKNDVWRKVGQFKTSPWKVEVSGLVQAPGTFDLDDLCKAMPAEQRIYRLRCVEAWSMVVPWTGFPLRRLLESVQPLARAKYVRFWTAELPKQMPGQRNTPWYPWPYHEALRIDEAMNDLTLVATGIYGKPLLRQHGAPIRLVVPWKYGYKSIKSIVRIELVEKRPATFWNTLEPAEYSFLSNVDPDEPHPRWSQATERDIQTDERIPTLPYNGYGDWVADMY